MIEKISKFIDRASEYFSARKGLLPLLGLILIILNLILQFTGTSWLSETDILLHIGLILAILGFMLAWAL